MRTNKLLCRDQATYSIQITCVIEIDLQITCVCVDRVMLRCILACLSSSDDSALLSAIESATSSELDAQASHSHPWIMDGVIVLLILFV